MLFNVVGCAVVLGPVVRPVIGAWAPKESELVLGLATLQPVESLQYPSPLCRLTWAVTHVIGLHVKLTILGECDVALMTIFGMLISNIVLTVDTRAH
jgi:hypothetical protein